MGTIAARGQQSCDVSAFKASAFAVYFTESAQFNESYSYNGGTITFSYELSAQGQASMPALQPYNSSFLASDTLGAAGITGSASITSNQTTFGYPSSFSGQGFSNPSVELSIDPTACTFTLATGYEVSGQFCSSGFYGSSCDVETESGGTSVWSSVAITPFHCGYGLTPNWPLKVTSGTTSTTLSGTATCPASLDSSAVGSGSYTITWSTSPLTNSSGAITITSVKITQGQPPENASPVSLILNRPAAVQLQGSSSGTVPDTIPVTIKLDEETFGPFDVKVSDLTATGTTAANQGTGAYLPFTPIKFLDKTLTVSVDNPPAGVTVTVPANPISVSPVLSGPTKYLFVNVVYDQYPITDFNKMVDSSNSYINAVFPIDPTRYTSLTQTATFTTLPTVPGIANAYIDGFSCGGLANLPLTLNSCVLELLLDLSIRRKLAGAEAVIGIVPQLWMKTYVKINDPSGDTNRSLKASLVEDDVPEATAHELGHIYGLYDDQELYKKYKDCLPKAPAADTVTPIAFWVQQMQFIAKNWDNYMCVGPGPGTDSFFSNDPFPQLWTTSSDWIAIGKKLTGVASFDPEILIVAAFVDQSGNFYFQQMYRDLTGTPDPPDSTGTYTLQVLSNSGAVLSSTPFTPTFGLTDAPDFSAAYAPVVLSPAYPSNATFIRILNGNSVIATQNIAFTLLSSAVSTLQGGAFVANATERRTALVDMVNAFGSQLAAGNTTGAYQFLTHGIEPQISSWLSDSYVAPNPLFYTKTTLLSLIDEIAGRLTPAQ